MNTTKLKRFATEARNKLRQGVEKRLAMLGFNGAGVPIETPKLSEGGATWKGKGCTVAFYNGFKSLEEQIRRYGVSHVVEEAAYTWFNRLMAIRILTMNELCEPVLRYVGSTRTPLIVDEARQGHIPDMDEEDREALMKLIDDDTKTAEQFAMLISAFCHNTPLIAKCFCLQSDYTDVLFPANILAENGFIDMLNTTDFITEEDYHSSELLGWLYQFYISEKKDQVFAKKGKYDADDIPAATQIFTPNWIVKYMVQNTIGGVLGGKDKLPENQRKYYVDTPEPPKAICHDIEELKVADLACGSGHILNECFDLLYDLYISEGYTRREAIECIFTQNLTGIDIDTRAKQLATFALMLKACQRDSSHVDASIMPKILSVPSLENTKWETIYNQIVVGYEHRPESQNVYDELEKAFTAVQSASILGSIIKFELSNEAVGYLRALNKLTSKTLSLPEVGKTYPIGIKEGKAFEGISYKETEDGEFISYYNSYRLIKDAINFILALSDVYDAIVMNPPYMPTNKIDSLSKYVNEHYKEGKADMFTVFMMVCIDRLKEGGRMGMINMQSWMFLSSFESLRELFLKEYTLSSMLHLGPRTFDELSGEVVQNTAFVFEKIETTEETTGVYYRIVDGKNCSDKETMFLGGDTRHEVEQGIFEKIPGMLLGYWVSNEFINNFSHNNVGSVLVTREGMATADNDRFLRLWPEVSKFRFSKIDSASDKWYPYNKGGSFRKWYGNRDYVVDWANNGFEIRNNIDSKTGRIRSHNYNGEYAFRESITWSAIASGNISLRYCEEGFLWDSKGASGFSQGKLIYSLGLINSKVSKRYLDLLSPTLDFKVGDIIQIPYLEDISSEPIVLDCVSISKQDWDAHETSWDFEKNPLLAVDEPTYIDNINYAIERHRQETGEELCIDPAAPQYDSLKWRYEQYCQKWESLFMKLHANEEELNRRFIEIYGLQNELTPDVPLSETTILQQGEISISDKEELIVNKCYGDPLINYSLSPITFNGDVVIKQFISYAVGCMMGRYRLDRPGLAIAHPNETPEEVAEYQIPGTDEKFWIDTDGIIPLLPEDCGFHDNAANRMATFVRQVLGEETQTENLNFIEECLGKSIEQYFMKDFWKDHKKMYQNRPIYWLFASKKGAFQVLVYVHRMNVATVERIRSRYLLPYIERLNKRIDDLQANESTLSTKQRNQLKTLRAQVAECEEYHNRLAVVAERGIAPNLDDGIIKNHALYGDIVTKLK